MQDGEQLWRRVLSDLQAKSTVVPEDMAVVPRRQDAWFSLAPRPRSPLDGASDTRTALHGLARIVDHPSSMLNPRYVFESFTVGSSNRFAYASAVAVAEHPGERFNPLFIWGGVELGTPHLLQAIGNQALRMYPGLRVCYVEAGRFVRDLARATQCHRLDTWRTDHHAMDMLLIDDIQSIACEEDAQQELYNIFMQLHGTGKQIVLAGDRPPKAITGIDDRLRSRFEWGLIVELQPPDLQTRIAILHEQAANQPVPVPKVVIDYIVRYAVSNIREPEGALTRVTHMARELGRPVTLELAIAALAATTGAARRVKPSPEEVLAAVLDHYAIDREVLLGRERGRMAIIARQVAMYLLREETDASLSEIGTILRERTHSTVMHGYQKIADDLQDGDEWLRKELRTIRGALFRTHEH